MSWLAKSLSNSLNPINTNEYDNRKKEEEEEEEQMALETPLRGVKEDLSELTQTLTRHLWGVATFLAPPPSISDSSRPSISDSDIGGMFRTGISRLSGNKEVTEISKIASGFLPFGSDEMYDGAVGVTDEVLAFARNISMHPETWLDFPLFTDDVDDPDDFDMSDAQQKHALAIECLLPRLAALRIELCPSHMSEGCFWKIYFVLLHSRLNKHDAELLLTPQIVEARALWLQELQNHTKPEPDRFGRSSSYTKEPVYFDHVEQLILLSNVLSETTHIRQENSIFTADFETECASTEMRIINKSVVEEGPMIQTTNKDLSSGALKALDHKYEEEGDNWLEDNTEMDGITITLCNEEDISFSDLDDDDDDERSK